MKRKKASNNSENLYRRNSEKNQNLSSNFRTKKAASCTWKDAALSALFYYLHKINMKTQFQDWATRIRTLK